MDIQLDTLRDLAKIVRPCNHTQPQPLPPCPDCTNLRAANLSASLYAEIKREVVGIAAQQDAHIKRLDEQATADHKRIDKLIADVEARDNVILRLEEAIRERDRKIAEMQVQHKAEQAAAAGYIVGPIPETAHD